MNARELVEAYRKAKSRARAYKAHLECLDRLRKAAPKQKTRFESGIGLRYEEAVASVDQLGLALADSIARLDKEEHRTVLTMHLLEEKPVREIEYCMGYSTRNVYRLIEKGIKELDEVLGK